MLLRLRRKKSFNRLCSNNRLSYYIDARGNNNNYQIDFFYLAFIYLSFTRGTSHYLLLKICHCQKISSVKKMSRPVREFRVTLRATDPGDPESNAAKSRSFVVDQQIYRKHRKFRKKAIKPIRTEIIVESVTENIKKKKK